MKLAVLTTGRQDWDILRSIVGSFRTTRFELSLWAAGMHFAAKYGRTVDLIAQDGFQPAETLDWLTQSGESMDAQASAALSAVAEALRRHRPDALVLVGDRVETAAAALAATISRTPIVHLHGGEETEGAIDNALRHAITKMSHLHLVARPEYRDRVLAMGEAPETVHLVGAPGLDNLFNEDLASREELERDLGVRLSDPLVVVTVHPTTLSSDSAAEARACAYAMEQVQACYLLTLPNSDPGNEEVRNVLVETARKLRAPVAEALGARRYWGALKIASAVLGNSSSGVIEAPALGVPTVNVGDRQKGRERCASIIDVPPDGEEVQAALARALSPQFRQTIERIPQHEPAAPQIISILSCWTPPSPPRKTFHRGAS